MIDLAFIQNGKLYGIKIEGYNITFLLQHGGWWKAAPLEGLKFDIGSILQEHPDLKDKEVKDIKKIAIERFRKKIQTFNTETEIMEYLKEDLKKYGFTFNGCRRKGFREQK